MQQKTAQQAAQPNDNLASGYAGGRTKQADNVFAIEIKRRRSKVNFAPAWCAQQDSNLRHKRLSPERRLRPGSDWRRARDSNPRYRFWPVYSLSRRAPSTDSANSPRLISFWVAGGGGGIRTHGTLSGSTVFKTVTFNRSDTPPLRFRATLIYYHPKRLLSIQQMQKFP